MSKYTTTKYLIEGMSCGACAQSAEKILSRRKELTRVNVNYASKKVQITAEQAPDIEELNAALKKAGYELLPPAPDQRALARERAQKKQKKLFNQLLLASLFATPLFVVAMLLPPFAGSNYLMLFWASMILFGPGRQFFVKAWQQLQVGQSNMDTLVALGTGTAYLYSVVATFLPDWWSSQGLSPHVYFETAGLLQTFILLGRYLEGRAKAKASKALDALLDLQPPTVQIWQYEIWTEMPLAAAQAGDRILIRPGEQIPLDATILEGESEVDEQLLTGESLPQHKQEGDAIWAGTLNQTGRLVVEAKKGADQSRLAQIIELVETAQSSKAPIQKLVDKISGIFVPVILVLALFTALIWFFVGPEPVWSHALNNMVAVLVIACPCALGLATPMAIMLGIGRGAKLGLLLKGAESLEAAQQIDAFVFDKTGSLTEGKMQLQAEEWLQPMTDYWPALYALEENSEHPLAKALLGLSDRPTDLPKIEQFQALSGRGILGQIAGQTYAVGNRKLLLEQGLSLSDLAEGPWRAWETEGQSVLFLAVEQQLIAAFAFSDVLRVGAKETVAALQARGIKTYMLSGDQKVVVDRLANELGIAEAQAELLPEDKINFIKDLQAQGQRVGMLGDGLNDAPALAQADLGVSLNAGTGVALEAAEALLLKNEPWQLVQLLDLGQASMKILRQNLFWAFAYNLLGIPIAAGLLYPFTGYLLDPMLAGAAMAFSSVSVVLNSLRLLSWRMSKMSD
ncbi:heavy metal translocating P-type ATPase [Saprospira sp. CCB-QB6]|uniref:heavy metal translocating P-type ATPase n=1 Tax=Saprospira sp. CCB-QB6 TaxID=3023936 RepID=UPI0023490B51|nr:heavy metal translocating P-type ATPase [Saprospira sp. CCB-QB6]WCL80424.1 heavy metal translocating P-type ATPase [Saprospira sp. CCB-QB6]